MQREMRRSDRQLAIEEAKEILTKAEYGSLATIGEDGYPYVVPVSYAFEDSSIYIHGATEWHKLDNINFSSKVSFCVVGDTNVLPSKFSTEYESVIVFGRASIIEQEEKLHALECLIKKYSPDFMDSGMKYIANDKHKTTVVKIDIEKITGKARR